MSTATRSRPPAGRIEPKLQARRIEVARTQGRKRLRRVVGLLVAALLVVGMVLLVRSPALDVDHVQVVGANRTGSARVRAASGIVVGEAMTSVRPGAAASQVEALPYVAHATVSRRWPGTVRIVVTERRPVAVVGNGRAAVVVDRGGRALARAPKGTSLPVLSGDPVAVGQQLAPPRQAALAVLAELPTGLRRQVAAARVTPTGVVLTLDDDIEVRWGSTAQGSAKAEALQVLLDQADRSTIASIDVTVPRASTLKRQNGGK